MAASISKFTDSSKLDRCNSFTLPTGLDAGAESLNTILIYDDNITVPGPAQAYNWLSPYFCDKFSHDAGAIADKIASQNNGAAGEGNHNQASGQSHAARKFAKVPSRISTESLCSVHQSYWYIRCEWAGNRSTADSTAASVGEKKKQAAISVAREYGYGGNDKKWQTLEENTDIVRTLVGRRFLNDNRGFSIKEKLLETGNQRLVFITKAEEWRHWRCQLEKDYMEGLRKGIVGPNVYGEALMWARSQLNTRGWQCQMETHRQRKASGDTIW